MSSTYSTNLRTELIGSGDQAGTWGTTTNTSLGSILEQAIAGVSGGPYVGGTYPVVNFPTDADITLTANNGSVDQSRSAVLVVTSTGSLTATRNVVAPASASKVYIVKNSTTGGQSIQIKYSTGTAVLIPNGQTIPVYGDGSNFYTAVTNTVPAGSIQMWATATAPSGYVICNGVAISRTLYSTLYGVIGTTFGVGDGSTTFNVPDYTNRMPYGTTVGTTGGAATTTIATTNLPSHTHSFSGSVSTYGSGTTNGASANIQDPGHAHGLPNADGVISGSAALNNRGLAFGVTSTAATGIYDAGHSHSFGVSASGSFSGTTDGTGSGTAITTISPYLGINFIIKT